MLNNKSRRINDKTKEGWWEDRRTKLEEVQRQGKHRLVFPLFVPLIGSPNNYKIACILKYDLHLSYETEVLVTPVTCHVSTQTEQLLYLLVFSQENHARKIYSFLPFIHQMGRSSRKLRDGIFQPVIACSTAKIKKKYHSDFEFTAWNENAVW